MEDLVLLELAIEVIALISPRFPLAESCSSFLGLDIEKCLLPLCAKIRPSLYSFNRALVALDHQHFEVIHK